MDTLTRLCRLVAEELHIPVEQVSPDDTLASLSASADSLDAIELTMALEEEFDLELAPETEFIPSTRTDITIREIADWIGAHRKK